MGKNLLCYFAYRLALLLVPLALAPYLSRVLGPSAVGLFGYENAVLSCFLLFAALGTAEYGRRAAGYAQGDVKERSRVFFEIFFLRLFVSAAVFLLYLCYALLSLRGTERAVALCLSFELLGAAFDVSWFLEGMEEFRRAAALGCGVKLLSAALIFLFVKGGEDLPQYALLSALSALAANLCMWPLLPRYVRRAGNLRPFRHLKGTLALFLPAVAVQIYTVLDKFLLGRLAGFEECGCYEQAEKLVRAVIVLVTANSAVAAPRAANLFREGKEGEIPPLLSRSFGLVLILSLPAMLGLSAVADLFLPLYLGEGYGQSVPVLCVLSAAVPLIGMSNAAGMQFLVPTKRQNLLTGSVLCGAAVNLLSDLLLIPKFGALGAALGTVAAEGCVTAAELFLLKRAGVPLSPFFSCGAEALAAGSGMFALVTALKPFAGEGAAGLTLLVLCGAGGYFLLLCLFLLPFGRLRARRRSRHSARGA